MIRRAGAAVTLVAAIGLLAGCASAPTAPQAVGRQAEPAGLTAPKPSTPADTGTPAPAPAPGPGGAADTTPQPGGPSDLPQGLSAAVQRDLGISPQHYLDQAQTAATASNILPALEKSGVKAADVWIDDTTIRVHTTSATQERAVSALGADPTAATPPTAPEVSTSFSSYDNLDNGQGWYLELNADYISICSTGFNGYRSGAKALVTAGHCLLANDPVPADPVTAYRYNQTKPNQDATAAGLPIGNLDSTSFQFGGGRDAGIIPVTGGAQTPRPLTSTWNGSTLPVRGTITATNGASICKSGRTTGWTCGKVVAVNETVTVDDTKTVNSVVTTMCMYHGDSGGAAMIGNYAVGINSAGSWSSVACKDKGAFSTVFPMQGAPDSVMSAHPDWEPAVQLDAPTVATSAGAAGSAAVTGKLTNATTADSVSVSVDGTPIGTAPVAANGTWSVPATSVTAGMHLVTAVSRYGANSASATTTAAVQVGSVSSRRLSGLDRYATAAAVSQAGFPDSSTPVKTVYIASGENFPDALVAGPAAAAEGGPVLLTKPTTLPTVIGTEVQRLNPGKVIIVGGTGAVSAGVEKSLRTLLPDATVERRQGADRYATARAVVAGAYTGTPIANLYIATGQDFPDSLSASAAGAFNGSPVLTIPGNANTLDATTKAFIQSLHPAAISVVGGTGVVTAPIYTQLAGLVTGSAANLHRYSGPDRFSTSQAVAQAAFPAGSGGTVLLASGLNYPDALVGSALAGALHQPMLITLPTCVANATALTMGGWKTTAITLLGGAGSVSDAVAGMKRC
ncbi:cell wall-binding repeat-containing protein [Leifsonia sp. NPDC080035]|uniref:Cell wall-binding repeat-containing protein n=1 Tax=Leifsonia sp. NPDC080035 TaxID=3143936 RepID=A0AAU7GC37_9MICO